MAERLIVGPFEPPVILLNEVFGRRYSSEVGRALHGSHWSKYYTILEEPARLESFLEDRIFPTQRYLLLSDRMAEVLNTLEDKERRATRMRFGFEDSMLPTLKEISRELGFRSPEGSRLIISRSLRKLNHPSRRRCLEEFLPESPSTT